MVTATAAPLCIDESISQILNSEQGADGEFTFVVLGDSQSIDIVYLPILEQIKEESPAFILHTGDLTFSGLEHEYEHYEDVLRSYPIPIVHVAGNHDIMQGKENYACYVGAFNWCFDYGGCRFVGLDNSSGAFSAASIDYAACTLEADSPTFLAFHHPPHYKEWDIHAMLPESNGGNGDQLLHMLQPDKVKAAFSGHLHLHDRQDIDGIPFIISGCGGARIYKFGFGVTEYGYVRVNVRGHGNEVDFTWVPLRDSPFG